MVLKRDGCFAFFYTGPTNMSGLIFYKITLYKLPASLPPLLSPSSSESLHAVAVAKLPSRQPHFWQPWPRFCRSPAFFYQVKYLQSLKHNLECSLSTNTCQVLGWGSRTSSEVTLTYPSVTLGKWKPRCNDCDNTAIKMTRGLVVWEVITYYELENGLSVLHDLPVTSK